MKAIIFDFDGMVFLADDLFSVTLSKHYGVPAETFTPFFKNCLASCQRGEMDVREALEQYLPSWGISMTVDDVLDMWFADGNLDQDMLDLIAKLRAQGVLCGLCTNNEARRIRYMKDVLKVDDLFDFVVASCEEGVRKPDPKIYQKVLDVTGLGAEDILVCDDMEENFSKLHDMGFKTYVYQNKKDFSSYLEKLGLFTD